MDAPTVSPSPVLPVPTPASVTPVVTKSPSKLPWILLVIVLMLAFGTGGAFLGMQLTHKPSRPLEQPTPTPTAAALPSKDPSLKTFAPIGGTIPITFQYPTNLEILVRYYVSGYSGGLIDNRAIILPEVADSALTPVSFDYYQPANPGYKNYKDRISDTESQLTPESLVKTDLSHNGVTGILIKGTNKPDSYGGGEKSESAIFDTPNGPVIFNYFGDWSGGAFKYFNEDIFLGIVKTVQLIPAN